MITPLRIIFAGTPVFAACHLNALLSSVHKVVGVFTQPDRPTGRGRKLISGPVKILAQKHGLPIFQPISLYEKENEEIIASINADIMVVVAYGLIFPKKILEMLLFGCINVHGSLLPRWRGAAPIQRSIWSGDIETGITIIQMDTGLDNGDIIYKLSCPITTSDTSKTLSDKLIKLGVKGLMRTLKTISEGRVKFEKQNDNLVTYANKINKKEARLNWLLSAEQLDRCVRAFNPWPTSWLEVNKNRIKVWKTSVVKTDIQRKPGTIINTNNQGIQIATAKNILNLEFLQPAGKKIMSARDFLNSRREWFVIGRCIT